MNSYFTYLLIHQHTHTSLLTEWWSQSVYGDDLGGHDGQRPMGEFGQDAEGKPLLFFEWDFYWPQRVRTSV